MRNTTLNIYGTIPYLKPAEQSLLLTLTLTLTEHYLALTTSILYKASLSLIVDASPPFPPPFPPFSTFLAFALACHFVFCRFVSFCFASYAPRPVLRKL